MLLGARVNSYMAMLVPRLGQHAQINSSKAERLLGRKPRSATESVIDAARDLSEHGIVS